MRAQEATCTQEIMRYFLQAGLGAPLLNACIRCLLNKSAPSRIASRTLLVDVVLPVSVYRAKTAAGSQVESHGTKVTAINATISTQ